MTARPGRVDRRTESCCATAAALFAACGTGAPASAVHQYAVVHDGSMASAGVAHLADGVPDDEIVAPPRRRRER
ncbi:hypothetical protein [Streptomyces sp. HM190]|uniref:hypothetical protein n=1 Tax=Streptomyces sp. HM190 TaxID=2695266 RepID=UPI00135AC656|nr:hypothetical protein [Streptomyces sp. HM190]